MILKSFISLVLFTLHCNGAKLDFSFNNQADGWLKLIQNPATWEDAKIRCHIEGGVLASPITGQLREAIKDYVLHVNETVTTIYTGGKSGFFVGDYLTIEGISDSKLPLNITSNETIDQRSDSCLAWTLANNTARRVRCSERLPFVCYKKIQFTNLTICGTSDAAYNLDTRTGSCYKFHRVGDTWSGAYKTCAAEGGYLAIINSDTEANVLKELFVGDISDAYKDAFPLRAFVGIRDWTNGEGEFTTDGSKSLEEAGFSQWHTGEPNNANHKNQHCGTFTINAELYDDTCSLEFTFICEKEPIQRIVSSPFSFAIIVVK